MAKKLYLLLGVPGIGKSSWIDNKGLDTFTLNVDKLRQVFGNNLSVAEDDIVDVYGSNELIESYVKGEILSQAHVNFDNDKSAWELVYKALGVRMSKGETSIVDATHLFKGAFSTYRKLASKYHYKIYLIDFMQGWVDTTKEPIQMAIEAAIKRDKDRFYSVGEKRIKQYGERYKNFVKHINQVNDFTVITPDEFESTIKPENVSEKMKKFDTIQVIGDIHGDYGALQKVFENHHKGTAYVFVGDYLDRGSKEVETFDFLTSLKGNNIFFLRGNHDANLEAWEQNRLKKGQFGRMTLPLLLKHYGEKDLDSKIRSLSKQMKNYLLFSAFGREYLISHAGVDYLRFKQDGNFYDECGLISQQEFTVGLKKQGSNPYERNIDSLYFNNRFYLPNCPIQIHGHRNEFDVGINDYETSYNLTKDDKFRWLTITKDGIETHEIDRIDGPSFISTLVSDPHVVEKQLDDGIVSHNFDREVFQKNLWYKQTLQARGLFSRGDEIIGRGFQKFFEVDSNEKETLDSLEYPVEGYRKYNGFLAIVFWDKEKNTYKVMSKSGGKTYSSIASSVITFSNAVFFIMSYYQNEENRDYSLLFEIIDPTFDPHIEKYDHRQAFFLAAVQNDAEGRVLTDPSKMVFKANNKQELEEKIREYLKNNPTKEGLVLYGRNKMLKIKSKFYLKAKELRTALNLYKNKKVKKSSWYYEGAEEWFDRCIKNGDLDFSPDLALKLYKEDLRG